MDQTYGPMFNGILFDEGLGLLHKLLFQRVLTEPMSPGPSLLIVRRVKALLLAVPVMLAVGLLPPAGAMAATTDSESLEFFEDGQRLFDQGDLNAAVIQLKNAIQRDPNHAAARYLLGRIYIASGNGASAEKELRKARSLGGVPDQLIVDLGRAYLLQGKFRAMLEELPLPEPDHQVYGEMLLLHGDAQLASREAARARESYDLAAKALPEDPRPLLGLASVAIADAQRDQAESYVDSALTLSTTSIQALMLKGELRNAANDFKAARTSFGAAVELAPNNLAARLALASAQIALGQDDLAEESLSLVEQRIPNHPSAAHLRAIVLLRQGDVTAALARLEELGPSLDQHTPGLLLRGAIRYQLNQVDLAVADLRSVMARAGNHLPTQKLLGAAYLKQGKLDPAIDLLEQAAATAPDDPQLNALLGTAYLQQGQTAKALGHLERAASVNPDQPELLRQLALGNLMVGDSAQAVTALKSSLDLGADQRSTRLLLGLAELHRGNPDGTLTAAREIRAADPESPIGWNLEGGALLAKGQLDDARQAFASALELDADFLPARINLAQLALRDGNHAEAEGQFRQILLRDEASVRAYLGLARISLQQGNGNEAVYRLDKAAGIKLEASPERVVEIAGLYQAAGALDKALEILTRARRQAPDSAPILLALARAQAAGSEFADAIANYQAVLARAPDVADVHFELGQAQGLAGRAEEARRSLRQALNLNPDLTDAYVRLARLELGEEGLAKALELAEQLRARDPGATAADALAGDLYLASGRPRDALEAYEAGWVRERTQALVIGRSQAKWQMDDKASAISVLRDWLAENPEDQAIRMQLAGSLLSSGQQDLAIAEYEALEEEQWQNPILLNNLAYLYLERDDPRALDMARRAHQLAPGSPEIMDTLGWVLVRRDAPEEALEFLQVAAEALPDQRDVGYHLTVALDALGRSAEARAILTDILQDGRQFPSRKDAEALLRRLGAP